MGNSFIATRLRILSYRLFERHLLIFVKSRKKLVLYGCFPIWIINWKNLKKLKMYSKRLLLIFIYLQFIVYQLLTEKS